jgi:hypothetical protein
MSQRPESQASSELEESGFEALRRLYAEALNDEAEAGRVCARLLLGLYNGYRFPFDLTDLRTLPANLFEDAMTAIRMDARLTRQEVHNYFSEGGRKFEALVADYRVDDIERLKFRGDGSPRPRAVRGVLCHEDDVTAKLVTCGDAPGYRDVTLTLDCEVVGDNRRDVGPVRLGLHIGPEDGVRLMQHIQRVHVFAWRRSDHLPLDAAPAEQRPAWLDKLPSCA